MYYLEEVNSVKLSRRLAAVASLTDGSGSVLDVGTDHGLLPAWFTLRGARRTAASDLRPGPLARAQSTAERLDLSTRIEFFLTDGLSGIDDGFDEVILAGMGGETMISILSPSAWVRNARVILQPQSKVEPLCAWLACHGFGPLDAVLAEDGGNYYAAFSVTGGTAHGSAFESFLLDPLCKRHDPLLPAYLDTLLGRLRHEISGMECGNTKNPARFAYKTELISRLESWRDEKVLW